MNKSEKFRVNAPNVVHETIDGEVVLVNLEKGDYFSLVKVGVEVWDGLLNRLSRDDVLSDIIGRYEGDREAIENAVNDFIAELQQEELIIVDRADEDNSTNIANSQFPTIAEGKKSSFEPPKLDKYTDMEELLALDPIHEVDEKMGWPSAKVEV